jgi:hypothetical protein
MLWAIMLTLFAPVFLITSSILSLSSTEVSEIITDFGRERLTGVGLAICKV